MRCIHCFKNMAVKMIYKNGFSLALCTKCVSDYESKQKHE